MFDNVFTIDLELIKSVEWTGDPKEYDLGLYSLGSQIGNGRFLIRNPHNPNTPCLHYAEDHAPPNGECVIYTYEGEWIGKIFNGEWNPEKGYIEIAVRKPEYVWIKNQHLDRLMTFEDDPFGNFEPDPWDSRYKLVWYIDPRFDPTGDNVWAMTCIPFGVDIKGEKNMGCLTPSVEIEINEDLPEMGVNVEEYFPPYYHLNQECIWYLDSAYATEPVWVYKFRPTYRKTSMVLNCGEVTPRFDIIYNPLIGELNYDVDNVIPVEDFEYELIWLLDRQHLKKDEEDIWAFKMTLQGTYRPPKIMGYISPTAVVEQNPKFGSVEFNVDYNVHHSDFNNKLIWNIDKSHQPNSEPDEWCLSVSYVDDLQEEKVIDYISPRYYYEYNPSLPKMEFRVNYVVPWYDFEYVHKWMLDPLYSPSDENIWAINLFLTQEPKGEKEIGIITPIIKDQLDVIFISYYEPNAEENWQRVLEKAPWAKRVDGIEGIFEAHRQAALLSTTDMFYVVDGDAWLVDDWEFDYQPGIFDRDCAYVWHSCNPVNDLVYGYGGVKLFSKEMMLRAKSMVKLDMTTSVMPKLKIMEKISNETKFDVDEFSTWRSAFRESAKLCYKTLIDPNDSEAKSRLDSWLEFGYGEYGKYAQLGSKQGVEFVQKNFQNYEKLLKVNDRNWLEELFKSNL